MRVVRGKKLVGAEPDRLVAMATAARHVLIDVGTGDARTAYRVARAQPDWLVIGLDPAWRRMCQTSVRALRKPDKGGAPNLVLVCGAIEDPPPELRGLADQVWVLLPWGTLLRGIVLGSEDVCRGLRRIAKPHARLEITVGTSIWQPPVPLEIQQLPELTVEYVGSTLAPLLRRWGWTVQSAEVLDLAPAAATTSWGKRLGSAAAERVVRIAARAR